ncbi:MAG: TerB family tellurite resistance protein [Parvularcula sp.]
MTLWERILAIIEETRQKTLGAVMDSLAQRKRARDAASFSIALIALSAKMAKADGVVTDDEVMAFRSFFSYPPEEEEKVRTVFSLATGDVRGFDSYAAQVGRLFNGDCAVLEDVLDCLFFVALADGVMHPQEMELLRMAADKFGLGAAAWRRVCASHMGTDQDDPYAIIGVPHDADDVSVKRTYISLVKENHPDALTARGVPPDLVKISEHRMAVINSAYEKIQVERGTL